MTIRRRMRLADFQFDLPEHLIAQYPLPQRSASRLMCLKYRSGEISHSVFNKLPLFLTKNDLLIFNNTRVIPARVFGVKETGGQVEILVERILLNQVLALVRASKPLRVGAIITVAATPAFQMLERVGEFYRLAYLGEHPLLTFLEQHGHIPLPPYIERQAEVSDAERYQTVFGCHPGAVAAPTAGLHFDDALLAEIQAQGTRIGFVTLHVGAGTFQPIRVDNICDHKMHAEYIEVSAEVVEAIAETKSRGGRVIAVGTTTVRALETAARGGSCQAYSGDSELFIYPGYSFQCVDALITNFHLPGSSLLLLVSALAGYELLMRAYQQAIAEQYRFFSYGDAMFITA